MKKVVLCILTGVGTMFVNYGQTENIYTSIGLGFITAVGLYIFFMTLSSVSSSCIEFEEEDDERGEGCGTMNVLHDVDEDE